MHRLDTRRNRQPDSSNICRHPLARQLAEARRHREPALRQMSPVMVLRYPD
jgi:hypothetical protein